MKFLVTNDDGFQAIGLETLTEVLQDFGSSIVVAPEEEQSGCGHRATTQRPLHLRTLKTDHFALDGTPVDCVRVGLVHQAVEPDWVIAGINHGGNLGADVYHSGTIAAVREAALLGKPALAISHYKHATLPIDWPRAAVWVRSVLERIFDRTCEPQSFWSVNLPCLAENEPEPAIVDCHLDSSPLPVDYRDEAGRLHYQSNYHQRPRQPNSDVAVCFAGQIAVTSIQLGH